MKQLLIPSIAVAILTTSCSKAENIQSKEPDSKTAETQIAERVVTFPNFKPASKSDLENLEKAQAKLAELVGLLVKMRDQKDNLFVSDTAQVSLDLWAAIYMLNNMEVVIAQEADGTMSDATCITLLKAYLMSLRQINSSIPSVTNAGKEEPAITDINTDFLNTMTFIKREIMFKRFKEFDAAGGSIEKLADAMGVKL